MSAGQVSALRSWWVWQSHRNSCSLMDGCRCTLEVLHRDVDLPHPVCQQAKFLLSYSGESHSYSPPGTPVAGRYVARCTLAVLHRALDFLLRPMCQQTKFLPSDFVGCGCPNWTYVAVPWRFELHRALDLLPHQVCQQARFCSQILVGVAVPRNSDSSMDVCRSTLEVLHRAVDLLPHRSVSRPNFCSQILVSLTAIVLLELQWLGRMSLYTGSSPQGLDLLPHRCVSRPSFCSQILVGLRVPQELRQLDGRMPLYA